ncbi:MAG TPA: PIN domain-containing protein [Solirubrobacteraceae bacterium]|nr:PIN domain-containing protein [Solirubrobacteraceae bacterium]
MTAEVLVCDTSGLIAYFDASDAHHRAVTTAVEAEPGPFIVSPYVLVELDYVLATRHGVNAQLAVLRELTGGAWTLPCCEVIDVREAGDVVERYRDQDIGIADASIVVLAGRFKTDRILTLDHRHFRVIRTVTGDSFSLLP